MRLFARGTLTAPGAVPGRVRIATAHDVDLLGRWDRAFAEEVGDGLLAGEDWGFRRYTTRSSSTCRVRRRRTVSLTGAVPACPARDPARAGGVRPGRWPGRTPAESRR